MSEYLSLISVTGILRYLTKYRLFKSFVKRKFKEFH